MATALLGDKTRQEVWDGPVIDCDVHANVPAYASLFEYMEPVWVQWSKDRGWTGPIGVPFAYPPNAPSTARPEWRPDDRPPASDVSLLRQHVLEPWGTEFAIVNCYYALGSLRHPDWAAAIASAINDWLIGEWLSKDQRLRASLVVPARDPAAAIREIERVGDHPGFVQVLWPVRSDRLYGQRIWHPVYEAAARHDLVIGLHYGGTSEDAPTPSGWASWYVEEYASEWQNFAAQITSLILEGVFKAIPDLRVSVLEGGFTWVPVWGWRSNKEWRGLRREVPWVDRPPSEIIRDHIRFSVAPMDIETPEQVAHIVEWLNSDEILMFATDYPHMHDDDLATLLQGMPESMRPKVMAENAREWYRLPGR